LKLSRHNGEVKPGEILPKKNTKNQQCRDVVLYSRGKLVNLWSNYKG